MALPQVEVRRTLQEIASMMPAQLGATDLDRIAQTASAVNSLPRSIMRHLSESEATAAREAGAYFAAVGGQLSEALAIARRHERILQDAQRLGRDLEKMNALSDDWRSMLEVSLADQFKAVERAYLFAAEVQEAMEATDEYWPLDQKQPTIVLPVGVVEVVDKNQSGSLVVACAIPWLEIVRRIKEDPEFLFGFVKHPRNFEEFLAASYDRAGCNVILTPRSGDQGRDVIVTAEVPGAGTVRIYDQAKAYRPGHKVSADEVRAMFGVLSRDPDVSKAFVTTCSTFAPGALTEFEKWAPTRFDLRDGPKLREWLLQIAESPST